MIFPRIICSLPMNKVASIELSLAYLQLFTRVPAFSIFSSFSSQDTVNVLLLVFSEIELPVNILNSIQNFGKTIKTSHFVDDRQPLHSNKQLDYELEISIAW